MARALSRALAESLARLAAARGITAEAAGAPVDADGIEAGMPEGRRWVSHATPSEMVRREIELGRAAEIPQGLLDLAGLTRDGTDASAYRLGRATEASGVPERFRDVPPDASRNALFDAERPVGAWVYGDVGRGKTRMACTWLRGWLAEHPEGRAAFVTEEGLYASLRPAGQTGRDPEAERERLARAGLVVVDDVGQAKASDWTLGELRQLVDRRWSAGLPCVFTSQMSPTEWAESVSGVRGWTALAIMSRVAGSCVAVRVGGRDMRAVERPGRGLA